MQVLETKADGLKREFRVAVPASAIDDKVDGRLKELARTIRLPGFRPGKVPVALLRKRFGAAVRGEAIEQAVDDATKAVINEQGLRPAGQPTVDDLSADDGSDVQYTLAMEVLPEVVPPDYAGIEIERLVVDLDNAEVELALQRIAEAHGTPQPLSEPRPAASGDSVVIDFVGKVDGEPFPGGSAENYELSLGSGMFIPGFEDQLVGSEIGQQREVSVTFPEDYGAEHLAGKAAVFDVTVRDIRTPQPAAIDDELAKKVGRDSLDDLRTSLGDHRQRDLKRLSRLQAKRALLDKLAEQYDFAVPPSMVEREYAGIVREVAAERQRDGEASPGDGDPDDQEHDHDHDHDHEHDHDRDHDQEQGHEHDHDRDHDHEHGQGQREPAADANLTDEERADYRRIAERRVRLGLVLAEVGRINNLQVTQEDLRRAMLDEARRYPGQERQVLEFFEKTPQAADALAGPILEDKVVDFMLEMAAVSERTVTLEELQRAIEDDVSSPPGVTAASADAAEPDGAAAAPVSDADVPAAAPEGADTATGPAREAS